MDYMVNIGSLTIKGHTMKKIASTKAKSNFGELLDTAQREPVTIERQGRPVAVVVSIEEYRAAELLKIEALNRDIQVGIDQADAGKLLDADTVFKEIISDLEKA